MTRVAIAGAAGRMGKMLVQAVHEAQGLQLGAAFEREDSTLLGADAGEVAGVAALDVAITADPAAQSDLFDVVIDFTVPAATLALAKVCLANGKAMVVGTTGFTDSELADLHQAAESIALFMAPNMSVGVNLVFKLIEIAAGALGDSVDVEVMETHHRHKVDAPSGTAVRMGEVLAQTLGRDLATVAQYGREGITGERKRETIGFHSLRTGDVVGDHMVVFAGEGERIEITHRANSRMNFAQGAIRAVAWLKGKPPGLYDMQELLDL
jgi:4-hydroxy-tetrahydrodipicolinate reductase